MPITYEQIRKANEGLVSVDVKGKNYVMVNEKVKAFRILFPEGFIHTDILNLENGIVVMKSQAGYFDNGQERILGTGLAFEKQDSSFINKTSYIENCETSAVGRALSFMGLGMDDSICSAEELANAINNQNKNEDKEEKKQSFQKQVNSKEDVPKHRDAPATVTTTDKLPDPKPKNPVKEYVANEITFMKQLLGTDDTAEVMEKFKKMRQALIDGGVIEDVDSDSQTMEQAKTMIDAMYKTFFTDKKDEEK